jgi:acyl-CoA reductase-like NAD-dependent aldehyde dehydrogenase
LGLVAAITPWNSPIASDAQKVAPALAAGNAVLLKPGLGGSGCLAAFLGVLIEAGLAADLVQLLPEERESGQAALDVGVDYVVLTGRATTGISVLRQAAERLTPAAMELSGSDAVLVRADANLDLTAKALAFGLRLNHGATCIAPRRVLVQRAVATELEGRLERLLKESPPSKLSAAAAGEIFPLVQQALEQGAHLIAGQMLPGGGLEGPLVVAGVAPGAPLLQADLFAPILSLLTVADDDEAVIRANASAYALGASIFTADLTAARVLSRKLQVGVVQINDLIAPTADPRLPFGGRRRSGFGVTRGLEGLLEMTVPRVVTWRSGSWRPHYDPSAADDMALMSGLLGLAHGGCWRARVRAIKDLVRSIANRIRSARPPSAPRTPPDSG